MLDIEPVWFLVQMGGFFIFLLLMNIILYKPFLKIREEREGSITSMLATAQKASSDRDGILSGVHSDISGARANARAIVMAAREEGLAEQKKLMDAARDEAVAISGNAARELQAATEVARVKLRSDAEKIAGDIAGKLVGGRA
ncbi:MAG: ATP synthase F0 subunit B [Nitrospirae bacterium]|nr:ATP synthase F0 subunit B [Nitrospirota bacterium]